MNKALTAAERVAIARHPQRPNISDYISALFTDFFEQRGDRLSGEDASVLGGVALYHGRPVTVIGTRKGKDLEENLLCRFGMPNPEGYRKALRLMRQAEKFRRPVITFIDTGGAYPGLEAEERGQGEAIARNLLEMSRLRVPVVSIITGEGNSGGALALGVANRVLMLENAVYAILSPEGFAAILWKDAKRHEEASELMKLTAADLQAVGAMAALLKDAMKPNLIQTLEHTPALVHGGPFANIAHGCNSVRATRTALKMADYVITEAGFGADLGAEKFFDIKCRMAGLKPDAVVLVATVRALKYNGGVAKENLSGENMQALRQGIGNLEKHIENLRQYGVPIVVTLNSFVTDTQAETDFVKRFCEERGCEFALSEVWEKGGAGGTELASKVLKTLEEKESRFEVLYEDTLSLQEKIETIASRIYGADGVTYTVAAVKQLQNLEKLGFGNLPVCMAKTQYSLSDDPALLGRPAGFRVNVREAYVSAGAGFVVVLTGAVMTMPGLPKRPAACQIDVDENGKITGLF